jgi:periplasmic divalent cation tolerance protein
MTRFVLTTLPDEATAADIVHKLVAEKIAACGTIVPGARSIYNWKGSIEEAKEVVVIFKIPKANFSSFEKELREIHPYEVPEIVAFDPAAVCHAYADWIVSSCASGD